MLEQWNLVFRHRSVSTATFNWANGTGQQQAELREYTVQQTNSRLLFVEYLQPKALHVSLRSSIGYVRFYLKRSSASPKVYSSSDFWRLVHCFLPDALRLPQGHAVPCDTWPNWELPVPPAKQDKISNRVAKNMYCVLVSWCCGL